MRRIQDPSASASRPPLPTLSGPIGFFTNGTPGLVQSTILPDWWANEIQEELLAILTAAGMPIDGTETILQALTALYQPLLNFFPVQQGGGIGQTGQQANKIKIGYDGNRIRITVDASDFGTIALTTDFSGVLGPSSQWQQIPVEGNNHELILQSGGGTTNGSGTAYITFPRTFPNVVTSFVVATLGASGPPSVLICGGVPSAYGVSVWATNLNSPGSSGGAAAFNWSATGW